MGNSLVAKGIFEPQFSDGSYGYCPKRSAQQAIRKVEEYAEQGYTHAVQPDLRAFCGYPKTVVKGRNYRGADESRVTGRA